MNNKKSVYSWRQFFKDYWKFLDGRRLRFTFYTSVASLSHLIPFAIAYLLGAVIDFFIGYNLGDSLNQFYFLVLGIGFLGGFQVWLRFYGKNGLHIIAANIRKETRVAAMSKIMDLELKWHEKEETGSKIQKINQGGESIYKGMSNFSNDGIAIIAGLIGGLVLFLILDWRYLIFASIYIAVYLAGETYFNKRINYWQDRFNRVKEKVSGKMHESISNLLTIKSLGLKESFRKSTLSYETDAYKIWEKTKNLNQMKFKTVKIFGALAYAGFILLIGFDAVTGIITTGSILVFAAYFDKLKGALFKVTNSSTTFIEIKSSIGRFMTIFGMEIFDNEKDLLDIPKNWKTIEFDNVTFRYKEKNVLRDFSLKINRGEKIGIVGRSGCGKSTLTRLFLGLYHPRKGKILIDGIELKKYKHNSLTNTIAIVLQDSEMFNSSLLKNVTISSTKKDFKTFEKAVKISQLAELIEKLPKGINTLIGEKGYHLSGGERQRLGIARAIYKNTPMIILDEATSSLDSRTENLIQEGIEADLEDKTILIIAHRLSTLKNVDRIVVMEDGKIIEQGEYNELLRKKGDFYKLLKTQGAWREK